MKKILLSLCLLSLFVAGCGAKTGEAETVAKQYLETSLSYNFTEAKKYATGEALESMNLIQSYLDYSTLAAEVKSVSIIDASVSGDFAKVQAQVVREIASEELTESENRLILIELINLQGTWTVYNSAILKL